MSFGGFAHEDLFEVNMALRCEVKNLRRMLDEFKSGKRYLKIQQDHSRVTKGYIKEIERLKKELAAAHAEAVNIRKIWGDECYDVWQEHLEQMAEKEETIRHLEEKNWELQRNAEEMIRSLTLNYEDRLYEKDKSAYGPDPGRERKTHPEWQKGERKKERRAARTRKTSDGKTIQRRSHGGS